MTHAFTRILVPTDFSPPSDRALEVAKVLAATFGATLDIVHVMDDPLVMAAFAPEVYAAPPAGFREHWQQGAEKRLGKLLTPLEQAAFKSRVFALFGTPASTIVEYAAANEIDLIVMGTHGRTGVTHLLMGSVAERLVRTAPCPVLTVRDTGIAQPQEAAVGDAAVAVA